MKKTNLVLATVLTTIIGFGSGAAMADDNASGERSWKNHSGESHGGKHGKRGGRHGGGRGGAEFWLPARHVRAGDGQRCGASARIH